MKALALLTKYLWPTVIAAAVGYALLTQYLDHREEIALTRLPVEAVQARGAAKWARQQIPGCPPVQELVPTKKQREKIERDFDVDLAIVGEVTRTGEALLAIEKVPDQVIAAGGGERITTLAASGEVTSKYLPTAPPFMRFRPVWGGGLLVNPLDVRDGSTAYVLLEPLHLRDRWHVRLTAGGELRDGEPKGLVLAGIEGRF